MSYIKDSLLSRESIQHSAKIHWWTYMAPALFVLIGWLLYGSGTFLNVLSYIFLGVGIIGIINRHIERMTSEFAVTNKRVILKTGWIKRSVVELQLSKTEAIGFAETFWGRLLKFGTIIVTTGGAKNTYPYVADALKFRKAISDAVNQ